MPAANQLALQLQIVVDLAVEDDGDAVARHRLLTGGEIDDGEPLVIESDRPIDEAPLVVGPRCCRTAAICDNTGSSTGRGSRCTMPTMPHIGVPLPAVATTMAAAPANAGPAIRLPAGPGRGPASAPGQTVPGRSK